MFGCQARVAPVPDVLTCNCQTRQPPLRETPCSRLSLTRDPPIKAGSVDGKGAKKSRTNVTDRRAFRAPHFSSTRLSLCSFPALPWASHHFPGASCEHLPSVLPGREQHLDTPLNFEVKGRLPGCIQNPTTIHLLRLLTRTPSPSEPECRPLLIIGLPNPTAVSSSEQGPPLGTTPGLTAGNPFARSSLFWIAVAVLQSIAKQVKYRLVSLDKTTFPQPFVQLAACFTRSSGSSPTPLRPPFAAATGERIIPQTPD